MNYDTLTCWSTRVGPVPHSDRLSLLTYQTDLLLENTYEISTLTNRGINSMQLSMLVDRNRQMSYPSRLGSIGFSQILSYVSLAKRDIGADDLAYQRLWYPQIHLFPHLIFRRKSRRIRRSRFERSVHPGDPIPQLRITYRLHPR